LYLIKVEKFWMPTIHSKRLKWYKFKRVQCNKSKTHHNLSSCTLKSKRKRAFIIYYIKIKTSFHIHIYLAFIFFNIFSFHSLNLCTRFICNLTFSAKLFDGSFLVGTACIKSSLCKPSVTNFVVFGAYFHSR